MKKVIRILGLALLVCAAFIMVACSSSSTPATPAASSQPTTSSQVSKAPASTTSSAPTTSAVSSATPNTSTSAAPAKTSAAAGTGELTDVLSKMSGSVSVKYDSNISGPGVPAMLQKVYFKKTRMRMESTAQGMTSIILIDTEKQTMYNYLPAQKIATKMDFSKSPKPVTDSSKTIMDGSPVIIGTETVDGKICLVVQYTSKEGTVKVWLWKEKGFPVKMETTGTTGTFTVLNQNIDFSDIPDSTFDLPADAKIMDLGGIGGGGIPTGIPTNIPGGIPTNIPGGIPTNIPIPPRT